MTAAARVWIRCDAGAEHGLGHLSRSLVIARAVVAAGGPAPVLLLHAPEAIRARAASEGFAVEAAPGSVGSGDGRRWLEATLADGPPGGVLLVDSKQADAALVEACSAHAAVACVGDEVAVDLPCRLMINNHLWAEARDYGGDRPGRRLLLGPLYNTVAPAYFAAAGTDRRGVLISMGGEDPHDHTSWLIAAAHDLLAPLPVTVVIGPAHPAADTVRLACARHLPAATVVTAPPSLVPFAGACHIALSAGGTSCYEFAAAGMAIGAIAVEAHQERLVGCFVERGAALRLAGEHDRDIGRVRAGLERLLAGGGEAAAARTLLPAPGAPLIARALMDLSTRQAV